MFGTMKKAMVIAAVAGVGAVAPSAASADVWSSTGSAHASGTLTLTAAGTSTTCNVTAGLTLSNTGGVGSGSVNTFTLGPCSTTVPNCNVTAVAEAASLPWAITTSGTSVSIANVRFQNTYVSNGQGPCQLQGVPVTASGSVTGTASGDTISFSNAGPLTTTLGTATVDGSITVATSSGGTPITLS